MRYAIDRRYACIDWRRFNICSKEISRFKLFWFKVLCAITGSHKIGRHDLLNVEPGGTWVWGQWTHMQPSMAFGCGTSVISVILFRFYSTYSSVCLVWFLASLFLMAALPLLSSLFLTSSSFRTDFVNFVSPWFHEMFFMVDLDLAMSTFFCDMQQLQGWEKDHLQMSMMRRWSKPCRRDSKWKADPLLETTTLHNTFLKLCQGMHASDLLLTYNMSSRFATCVGRFSKSRNLVNMLSNKVHWFWTLFLPMMSAPRYGQFLRCLGKS